MMEERKMATVGIVAEYNPFHLGHKYQIDKIREQFGEDTAIVAIMSGNFTQRGEPAIFDKLTRASAAVLGGVNLVLELPFPYSMSSAEFFAEAGIYILDSLGCIDYLSFGSECADMEILKKIAGALSEPSLPKAESHDSVGYAARCEKLLLESGITAPDFFTSNNILAVEYLKALSKLESRIVPTTIKRDGADYNSQILSENSLPSAMAIRSLLCKNDVSALDFVPKSAKEVFLEAIQSSHAPCLAERLDRAVIASLRLNVPTLSDRNIHDTDGGLYNRIRSISFDTDSISSLTELAKTKKYTTARIRRAIWCSYLGVTSSDVKTHPSFTQLLAMDDVGKELLKRIKKRTDFPILTKPSRYTEADTAFLRAKELSDAADSVFQLTKPSFVAGDLARKLTPFVKKGDITR